MNNICEYNNNKTKISSCIDELDKQAIDILKNAPLMSEKEMRMAQKKIGSKRKTGDILDYWANKAYAT
ncbi:hypothetical protein [Methanococcus aeolicus]|uniref:hypothetical protein n=1 Tax=Methanococcus aeolicus TaxID=42879 RepID=UPI0021C789F0|nr:hypothetical protein [Methanococcus aeolicus]UXM85582.1 hypothetical protein N6C89_01845 [Methanococcus aeolicus]